MKSATLGLVAVFFASGAPAQDVEFFSVASGGVSGGYYAAAKAICDVVNGPGGDIYCSPEPTPGSLYNLDALEEGEVEFALVQSDWQTYAYEGTDLFADAGSMTNLRSVMSLYPEMVTILATRDSGIVDSTGLQGARVDIGQSSSGRYATLRRLIETLGLSRSYFARQSELADTAAIAELCSGRLDAVALIVGHPNAAVARALRTCDIRIASFSGPMIDEAFGDSPNYVSAEIPAEAYPQLESSIDTYAVMATVVTREDIGQELVDAMVAGTLGALGELGTATPILSGLKPATMSTDGLTAPLHEAAASAFRAHAEGSDR
jgi:TRAP transporter TAXI family solute receptor